MLLAAYTTNYEHIERAITQLYIEAAILYKDAIDEKIELQVAKHRHMSAIELLGLVQALMRQTYSFEFFLKAIESAAYSLERRDELADYRPYALFFLFTTSLTLDKPDVAELVLNSLGIQIPLAVRLGLHIESKSNTEKLKILKKIDTHTVDILRANKRERHVAQVLFQAPLYNKLATGITAPKVKREKK